MDLDALRLFLRLSGSLHFGRTSRERRISPSALTRAIQRLEVEAGAPLFVRDCRSVALTDEGRLLQAFASETLSRFDDFERSVGRSQQNLRGAVSIFASVTACQSFLPPLLCKFRRSFPAVQIRLETGYAVDALTVLRSGDVDVAVATIPEEVPATLTARSLAEIPLVFVAPVDAFGVSDLVTRSTPRWAEVPMIVPPSGLTRQAVDRWFRRKRLKPRLYGEVPGTEAILALVSLGCGVGVVPRLVADQSPLRDSLRIINTEQPLTPIRVGICAERKRLKSPILKALWDSIQPPG
jgi:LysR family transcriptional regulator, positive regulator for ilvC